MVKPANASVSSVIKGVVKIGLSIVACSLSWEFLSGRGRNDGLTGRGARDSVMCWSLTQCQIHSTKPNRQEQNRMDQVGVERLRVACVLSIRSLDTLAA